MNLFIFFAKCIDIVFSFLFFSRLWSNVKRKYTQNMRTPRSFGIQGTSHACSPFSLAFCDFFGSFVCSLLLLLLISVVVVVFSLFFFPSLLSFILSDELRSLCNFLLQSDFVVACLLLLLELVNAYFTFHISAIDDHLNFCPLTIRPVQS